MDYGGGTHLLRDDWGFVQNPGIRFGWGDKVEDNKFVCECFKEQKVVDSYYPLESRNPYSQQICALRRQINTIYNDCGRKVHILFSNRSGVGTYTAKYLDFKEVSQVIKPNEKKKKNKRKKKAETDIILGFYSLNGGNDISTGDSEFTEYLTKAFDKHYYESDGREGLYCKAFHSLHLIQEYLNCNENKVVIGKRCQISLKQKPKTIPPTPIVEPVVENTPKTNEEEPPKVDCEISPIGNVDTHVDKTGKNLSIKWEKENDNPYEITLTINNTEISPKLNETETHFSINTELQFSLQEFNLEYTIKNYCRTDSEKFFKKTLNTGNFQGKNQGGECPNRAFTLGNRDYEQGNEKYYWTDLEGNFPDEIDNPNKLVTIAYTEPKTIYLCNKIREDGVDKAEIEVNPDATDCELKLHLLDLTDSPYGEGTREVYENSRLEVVIDKENQPDATQVELLTKKSLGDDLIWHKNGTRLFEKNISFEDLHGTEKEERFYQATVVDEVLVASHKIFKEDKKKVESPLSLDFIQGLTNFINNALTFADLVGMKTVAVEFDVVPDFYTINAEGVATPKVFNTKEGTVSVKADYTYAFPKPFKIIGVDWEFSLTIGGGGTIGFTDQLPVFFEAQNKWSPDELVFTGELVLAPPSLPLGGSYKISGGGSSGIVANLFIKEDGLYGQIDISPLSLTGSLKKGKIDIYKKKLPLFDGFSFPSEEEERPKKILSW